MTLPCKARWASHKNSRIRHIRRLWRAYQAGEEDVPDLGNLYEYGLAFDYVAPETFTDQREGYWRWQLSYGGPSDEFRFYSSTPRSVPYRIAYAFLDWWDGHVRALRGHDLALMEELWGWFADGGATEHEYAKAMKE